MAGELASPSAKLVKTFFDKPRAAICGSFCIAPRLCPFPVPDERSSHLFNETSGEKDNPTNADKRGVGSRLS